MSGDSGGDARAARPDVSELPILKVRNLHVQATTRLGHVELVRAVELIVRSRELVGVVGESGSGKSTLCRAIARVLADGVSVTEVALRSKVLIFSRFLVKQSAGCDERARVFPPARSFPGHK